MGRKARKGRGKGGRGGGGGGGAAVRDHGVPGVEGAALRRYMRHWGSLQRACAAFVKFQRGEISRERLLAGGGGVKARCLRPALRWAVLSRDEHRCRVCGRGAG